MLSNILWIKSYRNLTVLAKQQLAAVMESYIILKQVQGELQSTEPPFDVDRINARANSAISDTNAKLNMLKETNAKRLDIIDNINIVLAILVFIVTFGLAYFLANLIVNDVPAFTNLQTEFYITVAGLLPVFLIALSVYSSSTIMTRKAYVADILTFVVPVFLGLGVCLMAVALNKSNAYFFMFSIYPLVQIMYEFVVRGFQKTINSIKILQ